MRKIISLVLVLAAIFTTMAYAEPEKGKKCSDGLDNDNDGLVDGDDPDCGSEPTPIIPVPVIRDAGGRVVGQLIGFDGNPVDGGKAIVLYRGDPASSWFFSNYEFAALSARPTELTRRHVVFFSQPNCTGDPYLNEQTLAQTDPNFSLFNVIQLPVIKDESGPWLYVPTGSEVSVNTYQSKRTSSGECDLDAGSHKLPAEAILLNFTSPYTLSE